MELLLFWMENMQIGLTSVVIPGVTSIGDDAFSGNYLSVLSSRIVYMAIMPSVEIILPRLLSQTVLKKLVI